MIDSIVLGEVGAPLLRHKPQLPYERIAFLDSYQAPFLEERLATKMEPQEYRQAFTEFKKYAGLTLVADGKLGMASEKVDDVWHQMILFTREYQAFCQGALGAFMHHRPSVSSDKTKPSDTKRFIDLYTQVYGALPAIWGLNQKDWCSSGSCSDTGGSGSCGNDCASCGNDGNGGDD